MSLTRGQKEMVREQLLLPLSRIAEDDAAQLEVHLCDTNGPKGGLDKECRVTLHLKSLPSLHVSERSENLYKSIQLARDRMMRTAKRLLAQQHLERRRLSHRPESLL